MPLVEPVVAFFVFLVESFTTSVFDNYASGPKDAIDDHLLGGPRDRLQCFTEYDPNDAIFQQFDPPDGQTGPMAWKGSRTSGWKFLLQCFKTVLMMQIIAGGCIGLLALTVMLLDINTADLCYEKTLSWHTMPRIIQCIRVAGQVVEGFLIELWHVLLMFLTFGWSLVKDANLLTINLLAAFVDMGYRLCLQIFGIYMKPWMSYPLNALTSFMVITNSVIIGRYKAPSNKRKAFKIAAILSSQFITGFPVTYVVVYTIIPWYNRQQNEIFKAVIAGTGPLIVSVPKVITRLAVQKLDIVHPGLLHILIFIIYEAASIVFRVMQAELTSFGYFVALGVGHAVIDLVERLTITMRDHVWEWLYRKLRGTLQLRPLRPGRFRTPRGMRLVADMSIQSIITESTTLFIAVGFIQIYNFTYSDSSPSSKDFFMRCAAGLAIDTFFSTVSVWLQAMLLNVAVLRVWKKKWLSHVLLNLIFTVLVMVYFTQYLIPVVRSKHENGQEIRYTFNCSMPFSKF